MPELILQVVTLDAAPPQQTVIRAFDGGGGTIGRDDGNSLALPDKHRRVSRLHATISFPGGVATITNSSASLPISVAEQQVDSGESVPIANGALIEIGPYVLQARLASAPSSVVPPRPAVSVQPRTETPVAMAQAPAPAALHPVPPPIPRTETSDPFSGLISSDASIDALLRPSVASAPTAPTRNPVESLLPGAPFAAELPPPVALPSSTVLPSAPPRGGDSDPFANLLAGIGAPGQAGAVSDNKLPGYATNGLSADPLAALGGFPNQSNDPFSPQPNVQPISHRPAAAPPGGLIPDDFNPFEMPSDSSRNSADPLANLLGNPVGSSGDNAATGIQPAPSIDSLFQPAPGHSQSTSALDMLSSSNGSDGSLANLLHSEGSSDPLALFDSGMTPPAQHRPMRDDSLEVGSSFLPPAPMREDALLFSPPQPPSVALPANPLFAPSPVQAPAAVAPPSISSAIAVHASPDALTDAFLKGAGLSPAALPNGLTPEIMSIVGSLLRSATAGAVDMLAARAATKREVQASVTIISVQANNPLKFLPNADAALLQLLGKKMPGFMRADVAMRDAFDDLRAHEVGVIAGTRAALTEVLGKFDPAVLGDKLARGSVLESLMPSARKAKLWDMYLERYLQIRREAEDDFQSIFGRAFVQAYERETARIKGESPATGGERA